jgi:LysM repeat protein
MEKKFLSACIFFIFHLLLIAQHSTNQDYADYISRYKDVAIKEMKIYHIPASITLAQGIIESNCGKSPLAADANNHFGVKCHDDWKGESYFFDDDAKQECFRKYASAEESYRDHSVFLTKKQRYAALFSLDLTDYTGWAMGLKQAGYATNPDYPRILIHMIELNKLYVYDDTTKCQILASGITKELKETEGLDKESKLSESNSAGLFNEHYTMPDPSKYEQVSVSKLGRNVFENNGIPFIFCKKGDTWYSIASEFGIYSSQVYHDNDMRENDKLVIGQIIYLESKKRKSKTETHWMTQYETLYSVSQLYGIKLKFLYKYNNLKPGEEPAPGKLIKLSNPGGFLW